jgi:hypothetical protein
MSTFIQIRRMAVMATGIEETTNGGARHVNQRDGSWEGKRGAVIKQRPSSPRFPPWEPTSTCGAPLWMKMVAARADLSEPSPGDRAESDKTAVARNPD